MSDGKYRWMRVTEADQEIQDGEYIWLCTPAGRIISAVWMKNLGSTEEHGYRICRAMVPEALLGRRL